ncbi:AMP-binding protein [Corynebacterium liangguodongii]|uniref:AMP-binding protein n=1 Tax=Corynebacterium liangguodongii TaxID=2079535 RepID=UPI00267E3030
MPTMKLLERVRFTSHAFVSLYSAAYKAGILDTKQSLRTAVLTYAALARYRFTTAREVELGAAVCPARNALIDDEGVLSYKQLRDQSRTVAKWLLKLKHDQAIPTLRIAIMARNGRGIIIPMAAKGYSGGELFLINVGSSPEQLAGIISENDINVLFLDDEFADRLPGSRDNLTVVWAHTASPHGDELTTERIILNGDAGMPELPIFPKHGDIVIMSSGTTGIPKGVRRAEPILPFVIAGYLRAVPWTAGLTVQATASMFHIWAGLRPT